MDAGRLGDSCMGGARFAQASDTDLAALEAAFAPVYAKLRQQPETKAFIDRIQALKRSTRPEPALTIPSGCTGAAPQRPTAAAGTATDRLNGTYRYQLTQKDADAVGDTDTGYPSVTTIRLRDGEFKGGCFGPTGGSYTVDDDRITFHSLLFDADFTVTFSVDDRGNLRLTPVPPMDAGDAFNCFYKPWQKID